MRKMQNNLPANDNVQSPRKQIIDAVLTEQNVLNMSLAELATYGYRSIDSLNYGYPADVERINEMQEYVSWADQRAFDRKKAEEVSAATEQSVLVVRLQKADLDFAVELGLISQKDRDAGNTRDLVVKAFEAFFDRRRKDAVEAEQRRQEIAARAAQEAASTDDIPISISFKRTTAQALSRTGHFHGHSILNPEDLRETVINVLADVLRMRRDGDEIGTDHAQVSAFMAPPTRTGTGGLRVRNTPRDIGRL